MTNLDRLIAADRGHPVVASSRLGLSPIYLDPAKTLDIRRNYADIIATSITLWTYLGYTGLIDPWHEYNPEKELNIYKTSLKKMIIKLKKAEIDVRTYCILCFSLSDYIKWERPSLLFCQSELYSLIRKLRTYAKSSENMDKVANFIFKFFELQVSNGKNIFIKLNRLIKQDLRGKRYLDTHQRILDRILQLESWGVDPLYWLEEKYKVCCKYDSDGRLYLNTIVNANSFDPDLRVVITKYSDPWREIRSFLELTPECEFPDGFIPKGWGPASVDYRDLKDIVKVMGDGFYHYKDGSQRKGKRHYAANLYYTIKCDCSNFGNFKATWNDVRFIAGTPTWGEYSQWALYPGIWDEKGKSLRMTKDIKWRR